MGLRITQELLAVWEKKGLIVPPAAAVPVAPVVSNAEFLAEIVALAARNGWMVHTDRSSRKSELGFPPITLCRGVKLLFVTLGAPSAASRTWSEALLETGATVHLWSPPNWDEIVAILS